MEHKVFEEIMATNMLPEIPESLGVLLKLLLSPLDFDMSLCLELINEFEGLEDNVVKVLNTNSKLTREIESLSEAVNYLGANNLKMILISFVTKMLLPSGKGRAEAFDSKKYWKHCLGTSIAGAKIAQFTGLSDESKIFTYGLIHDIGITVLDTCLPEKLTIINEKHMQGMNQLAVEKAVLGGVTHADIGRWICERWGLPEEICQVVGCHHNPYTDNINNREAIIVHLADSISSNYYENLMGLKSDFIYSERSRKELEIPEEFIDKLVQKIPKEIYKVEKYADVFF